MEGEAISTQPLWAGVGVAIGGFVWTLWNYFSTRASKEIKPGSVIGDVKVFGAALNDSAALNRIAEQLECVCDHARDNNKHIEVMADELTAIRKIMGRREDRGGRQEA